MWVASLRSRVTSEPNPPPPPSPSPSPPPTPAHARFYFPSFLLHLLPFPLVPLRLGSTSLTPNPPRRLLPSQTTPPFVYTYNFHRVRPCAVLLDGARVCAVALVFYASSTHPLPNSNRLTRAPTNATDTHERPSVFKYIHTKLRSSARSCSTCTVYVCVCMCV